MDTPQTPPSVFISYATPDKERAFEICKYLEDMGHTCWIAPRNIRAGQDYGEEIIHGIEQSRCFVLILSSAANKSIYVKREVERAVSKAKPVFPVRLEDVLPSPSLELHLASLHYLDAWGGVLHDHIFTLARNLSGMPDDGQGSTPKPTKRLWQRPGILAASAGCGGALALLVWWLQPPPRPRMDTAYASGTKVNGTKASEAKASSTTSQPTPPPALSHCSVRAGVPLIMCSGAAHDSYIHIRTAQAKEVVIPGGSGANSLEAGGIYSRSTYLPWMGRGSNAWVVAATGGSSPEQPLPNIPNIAAAVWVAPRSEGAPPLFYARTLGKSSTKWSYAFFAPFDTTDVEWSNDSDSFLRVQEQIKGPVWIDAVPRNTKKLGIRWRTNSGEWSKPAYYSTDSAAAQLASIKPLQDLADSIYCYKKKDRATPEFALCTTLRNVPLGEIFDKLRWGTTAGDLKPVDGFDFKQWAFTALVPPRVLIPAPTEQLTNCKADTACQYRVKLQHQQALNKQISDERQFEVMVGFEANSYGPWKKVVRDAGAKNFLALLPSSHNDLYFEATPLGGRETQAVRIKIRERSPSP